MSGSLRVPHEGLELGRLTLSPDALHYVTRVHRCQNGASLVLFDVRAAREATAELVDARAGIVVVDRIDRAPQTRLPVTVFWSVGKGDKPEQVVRDATVLGATRVVLMHTERGVARSDGASRSERLLRVATDAARQCGRGDLPLIEGPVPFSVASSAPGSDALRLVACLHPESRPLLAVLAEALGTQSAGTQGAKASVEVFIGPEGGLSPREIDSALEAGCVPVHLGPLVLRTETAVGFVLSVLRAQADLGAESSTSVQVGVPTTARSFK